LTLAAEELSAEETLSHVVVLVSDGEETCEADPCAAAKALAKADAKLVVHTIGAGVDETTRKQLRCIADSARGSPRTRARGRATKPLSRSSRWHRSVQRFPAVWISV